jgi:hypothetical protein
MPQDQTGAREASIAAYCFALLFMCMLGLLAVSDVGNQTVVTNMAAASFPDFN